jgi:hypothetical protein
MKRHLRFFSTVLLGSLLVFLALINWRLYHAPEIRVVENDTVDNDALCQLRYLRDAMDNNAARSMQAIYPEGYVFFNALYGLSWCDLAESLTVNSVLYKEAQGEVQRAFNNVTSKEGRIIFDRSLPLSYGAFYNGWLTYLLGKKLALESPDKRNATEVELFKTQCTKIANAINRETYPETYYGSSWPADVVVGVAALTQHDRLYADRYQPDIESWWHRVNQHLDPDGLIPHSARPTGEPVQNARGSSQSLMQCFLPEITQEDHGFATYQRFFSHTRFGLPGIREYPEGRDGNSDIDSGPVILGMGGAATIVGIRAMKVHGLHDAGTVLQNSVEALALPLNVNGRKKYLFGQVPIADVFITWAQAASIKSHLKTDSQNAWRIKFQMLSGGITITIVLLLVLMWREKK